MDGFFGERSISVGVVEKVGSDAFAAGIFLHVVKLY